MKNKLLERFRSKIRIKIMGKNVDKFIHKLVITNLELQKFIKGELQYDINTDVLVQKLQLPSNIFDQGAAIVKAEATKDSLRASLPTDVGANSMYTPGYHTPFLQELINAQITDVNLKPLDDSSISYVDPEKNIEARVIK